MPGLHFLPSLILMLLIGYGGGPAWSQSRTVAATGAETLTTDGAVLRSLTVNPANAVADKVIVTDGDPVQASHVVLREHSTNRLLQRNNLGFFVPWDGNPDTLIDNRFAVENGQIRFKILRDYLGDILFPLSVAIGYRTAGALKTGQFAIGVASAE